MHYPRTTWLLQPERLASPIPPSSNLSLLTRQSDYTFLSALLALSEDQLYSMTLHPLEALSRHLFCFPQFRKKAHPPTPPTPLTPPNNTPINRPTLPSQAYQFTCLPSQTTHICMRCLQESVAYDRLSWKVKYLITCPIHRLLLQRSCLHCKQPILSTRMDPLRCHRCHHPYDEASIAVPDDALFLLQGDLLTFQALGISLPLTSLSTHANDPRSPLPGDQYLALLRALSLSMRPLHTADFHTLLPSLLSDLLIPIIKTTLTPQERIPPLHIATIHWLFSQWPDHFFTFRTAFLKLALSTRQKKCRFPSLPHTFSTQAPQADRLLSITQKTSSTLRAPTPTPSAPTTDTSKC
jgi:TniQ